MSLQDQRRTTTQQTYLNLLQRARQVNDRGLVQLLLKKLNQPLCPDAFTGSDATCGLIAFPLNRAACLPAKPEPPLWWILIKLTLAIPGSVTALLLLSIYTM